MTEQMTLRGMLVLLSGLGIFWATVAVMIRRHNLRSDRQTARPQDRQTTLQGRR